MHCVLLVAYDSDRCSSAGTSTHAPAVGARALPSGGAGQSSTVQSVDADIKQRAPAAADAAQASARMAPKCPMMLRRMSIACGSIATCGPRWRPLPIRCPGSPGRAVPTEPISAPKTLCARPCVCACARACVCAPVRVCVRACRAHQRGVGAVHPHVRAGRRVDAARRKPLDHTELAAAPLRRRRLSRRALLPHDETAADAQLPPKAHGVDVAQQELRRSRAVRLRLARNRPL